MVISVGWIFLILVGCAAFKDASSMIGVSPLTRAQAFFDQGKYQEAIRVYRQIVDDDPSNRLAAEAQFRIGYTDSYFQNPKPDYAASVKEFQQVLDRFPKSQWADEAKNWIAILSQLIHQRAENQRLQKDLQQLMKLDIESEKRRRRIK
jgi:TolA-binding protein